MIDFGQLWVFYDYGGNLRSDTMVSYANALMERLVKLDSDREDYQTVLEDVKKKVGEVRQ
jgi:hypothetical protein